MKKQNRRKFRKGYLRRLTAMLLVLLMLPIGELLPDDFTLFEDLTLQDTAYASTIPSNRYVMQINTGNSDGSGIAYFTVEYYGTDNKRYTEVVFPDTGYAITKSVQPDDPAYNSKSASGRMSAAASYGYDISTWEIPDESLALMSSDCYIMYLRQTVKEFLAITIHAAQTTMWTVKGIQIYKASEIRGIQMYGYISPDRYLSFCGTLMAETDLDENEHDLFFTIAGDVVAFGNPENTTAAKDAKTLISYPSDYNRKKSDYSDGNILYRQFASASDYEKATDFDNTAEKYLFRLDLANVKGGGIDTFNALFGEDDISTNSTLAARAFDECLSVTMRYVDTSGNYRQTLLPITMSALVWAAETAFGTLSSSTWDILNSIYFFGQQGQSIQFGCEFPGLDYVVEWYLCYGTDAVAKAAKNSGLTRIEYASTGTFGVGADLAARANAVTGTNDQLYISGISLHKMNDDSYVDVSGYHRTLDVTTENTSVVSYYVSPHEDGTILQSGNYLDITAAVTEEGVSTGIINHPTGNVKLTPDVSDSLYMIILTTDNMQQAGTINDMELTLHYLEKGYTEDGDTDATEEEIKEKRKNASINSATVSLAEEAQNCYGYWPALSRSEYWSYKESKLNRDMVKYHSREEMLAHTSYMDGTTEKSFPVGVSSSWDGAYRYCVSPGNELMFFMNIPNVQEFTGATLEMKGTYLDDYQFKKFAIIKVTDPGRLYVWCPEDICALGSGEYMSYTDRFWWRADWEGIHYIYYEPDSGILVQPAQTVEIDFSDSTGMSIETDSTDVNDAIGMQRMTYQEAMRDLTVTKARDVYNIEVAVANDEYTSIEYGDTGSKNQFFFQLVFKKDDKTYTSSFVNANQQLEGDSFRSGQKSSFNIYTNGDYGDLVAVNILPDDISTDSDTFDKLKIDYIRVTHTSSTGTGVASIISNVGWIDIAYNDAEEDYLGTRSAEEMVRSYPVTETQYTTTLEFTLVTADGTEGNYNNQTLEALPASYMANIRYRDGNGAVSMVSVDLVEAIQVYANRLAGNTGASTQEIYSDTSYMFQPNRTNRFTVDFVNITSLIDVTFLVKAQRGYSGTWGLKNLSVRQVSGKGVLRLKSTVDNYGEYQRDYGSGNTLNLCTQRSGDTPRTIAVGDENSAALQVRFTDNKIVALVGEDGKMTVEAEEHESLNDTLDIQVMVKSITGLENGDTISASLTYQDVYGDNKLLENVKLTYNSSYQTFVCNGTIHAPLFCIPLKIELNGTKNVEIGNIQVTQIRNNNALHCFSQFGVGSYRTLNGEERETLTLTIQSSISESAEVLDKYSQTLYLGFGDDCQEAALTADNDVEVTLRYYLKNDASSLLYTSKTISLYESGISRVGPGIVVELPFSEYRLEKIGEVAVKTSVTGSTLRVKQVAVRQNVQSGGGTAPVTVEGWFNCLLSQSVNLSAKTTYFTPGQKEPERGLTTLNRLCPLDITFTTAADETITSNGKTTSTVAAADGVVQLKINYLDSERKLRSYTTVTDLAHITYEGSLESTQTGKARLLVPGIEKLLTVTVNIQPEEGKSSAKWRVGSLSVSGNIGKTGQDVSFAKTVNSWVTADDSYGSLDINITDMQTKAMLVTKNTDGSDDTQKFTSISEPSLYADTSNAFQLKQDTSDAPDGLTWIFTKQKVSDKSEGKTETISGTLNESTGLYSTGVFTLDDGYTYRLRMYCEELPSLSASILVEVDLPETEPEPEPEPEQKPEQESEQENTDEQAIEDKAVTAPVEEITENEPVEEISAPQGIVSPDAAVNPNDA